MANPYCERTADDCDVPPCRNACGYCLGLSSSLFRRLKRDGVTQVLLDAFLKEPPMTIDDVLIQYIIDYKNSHSILFGSKSKTKPEASKVKKMILTLIAAGIITHDVKFADDDEDKKHPIIFSTLVKKDDVTLALMNNDTWECIPQHH